MNLLQILLGHKFNDKVQRSGYNEGFRRMDETLKLIARPIIVEENEWARKELLEALKK